MECGKVRKVKKKQVKDDRIKQAEKKKRRLEKALAASAAIISELEKKNQKKKEEQQRLDDECAAIAEAVALHVLIGDESDESCVQAMIRKDDDDRYPWGCCTSNIGIFMGSGYGRTPPQLPLGWGGSGYEWKGYGSNDGWYFSSDVQAPYAAGVSEEALMAAQAVSSLQIGLMVSMASFIIGC